MPARHLTLGRQGEDAAEHFLKAKGYKLLDRNWRSGSLELDLICLDQDSLVFVEVKSRSNTCISTPADGLTRKKAATLVRAASMYLTEKEMWDRSCRFDLVAVVFGPGEPEINHLEDVIDSSQALCGGNAHWQPW